MARVKKSTIKNDPSIKYKDGYKYQLYEKWTCIRLVSFESCKVKTLFVIVNL